MNKQTNKQPATNKITYLQNTGRLQKQHVEENTHRSKMRYLTSHLLSNAHHHHHHHHFF
jgi:hypothetical protein